MSNVVEFQSLSQLRKLLAERDAELAQIKTQAQSNNGVKELLKLQILDMQDQMDAITNQVAMIQKNLSNLLTKLDS